MAHVERPTRRVEPGEKMSVVVMNNPDPTLPRPVLEVSRPLLPGRFPKRLNNTRLSHRKASTVRPGNGAHHRNRLARQESLTDVQ